MPFIDICSDAGFISDVNMDYPAKFRGVNKSRSYIFKNRDYQDFGM